MTDSVKIVGLSDLEKKMKDLGPKVQRKHMRTAVNQAARIVRDEARKLAPHRTGLLRKSIQTKNRKEAGNPQRTTFSIGVLSDVAKGGLTARSTNKTGLEGFVNSPIYYWRFFEFGTVKMSARPFMRPAFAATKQQQINSLKVRLTANIAKEAKSK